MRTERLQTLADGVFAIALTLLALELPRPADTGDLAGQLLHEWPFYAAYVVSFVTVAIVWLNHHQLMDAVVTADRTLVELNLALLLFVAAVPWPTGLLAEYVREPEESSAAAVTYGLVMALMAGSFTLIWMWLAHRPELVAARLRPRLGTAVRRSTVGPAAYGAAVLVALVSAPVAFALFAVVAVFFAVSGRGAQPASEPAAELSPGA